MNLPHLPRHLFALAALVWLCFMAIEAPAQAKPRSHAVVSRGKSASHKAKAVKPRSKAMAGKAAAGKAATVKAKAKVATGKAATVSAKQDDDDDGKTLTDKDKKKIAGLGKACATKAQKKSSKCKAFFADQQEREATAARSKLKKQCALAKNRKSKSCKAFLVAEGKRRNVVNVCGRKYGVAKKNEKVASFARRMRVGEARVRDLNDLAKNTAKLKGGKRYLVFKSPHDGVTLQGGELLAGEDFFTMQRPHRGWGKPLLVDTIRQAAQQVRDASPDSTTLIVGDLSKEGGGCLAPHKSHRGGLDADIGFFFRTAHQRRWLGQATVDTLDADRTWLFLKALMATGRMQFAFIDHGLQPALYEAALRAGETPQSLDAVFQYPRPIERARETLIRHLGGHDDHIHLRMWCADNEACALTIEERAKMAAVRMDQRGGVVSEGRRSRFASHRQPTGAVPQVMQ